LNQERASMEDWYPKRLAPRDGTPVILWIEDEEALPTYPVTVGVWETDDMTGQATGVFSGRTTERTSTSISMSSAGGRCRAFGRAEAVPARAELDSETTKKRRGATNL
jgi:hypothetical protein